MIPRSSVAFTVAARGLLGGVARLAAYFIDAAVVSSINDALACNRKVNPMELYGKSGKRRQRCTLGRDFVSQAIPLGGRCVLYTICFVRRLDAARPRFLSSSFPGACVVEETARIFKKCIAICASAALPGGGLP